MSRSAVVPVVITLWAGMTACRKDVAPLSVLDTPLAFSIDSGCVQAPNVFTPDFDGINDVFVVHTLNVASFGITIRADDGHVVFASADPYTAWNGIDPDDPLAGPIAGGYTYHLLATTTSGASLDVTKTVHLVTDHYDQCFSALVQPLFGDMFDPRLCGPVYASNDLICPF